MKKTLFTGLFFLLMTTSFYSQEESAVKLSGLMFGDYFYNITRDSTFENLSNRALSGDKDLHGFEFRRIYFTYDHKISDQFSTRFRLESQTQVNNSGAVFSTFIKDAYLNWKNIFSGSSLIFGVQPSPTFAVSEEYWGYRSLEKTIMDLRRLASSRDFGISFKGKINSSGTFKYWVMYGNGNTFGIENDKYKRAYAHIDLQPVQEFRVTLYGDYKFQAEKTYTQVGENFNNDVLTSALFLGYQNNSNFKCGVESVWQINKNDLITAEGNDIFKIMNRNALGVSAFGSFKFSELVAAVARFDYFDPNIHADYKGDSRNFAILGLSFMPHEKVTITPNVVLETYETPVDGESIDPSLNGRITFYYEFL